MSLDETGFGRMCHWTKPFLDESVVDEIVSVLDEMVLDESVFG